MLPPQGIFNFLSFYLNTSSIKQLLYSNEKNNHQHNVVSAVIIIIAALVVVVVVMAFRIKQANYNLKTLSYTKSH